MARSANQLLEHLGEAVAKSEYDASVFGAAFQRCGQARWWDALLSARRLQCKCELKLYPVQASIFFKALRSCTRGEHGAVASRQAKVVQYGREAWQEHPAQNDISTKAALNLCIQAERTSGLLWAEELLRWAETQKFEKDALWHNAVVTLYATHGSSEQVDQLLAEAVRQEWNPDFITLSRLVDTYAGKRDWRRVEALWDSFVGGFNVKPGAIQSTARAKAHLLCGRPSIAASVLDEVLDELSGDSNGLFLPSLQMHVEVLAICYHSSLDGKTLKRLLGAVQRGDSAMELGGLRVKTQWEELKRIVQILQRRPKQLRLHNLLATWRLSQSAMVDWPNYKCGSMYLARHE